MNKDYTFIGTLVCVYETEDRVKTKDLHGIYLRGDYVYADTELSGGIRRSAISESHVVMSRYDNLNEMFRDFVEKEDESDRVEINEDHAQMWFDFAIEEYTNAPMTEVERSCFLNLMASCLSVLI